MNLCSKYADRNEKVAIDIFQVLISKFHKIPALARDRLTESLINSLDRSERIANGVFRSQSRALVKLPQPIRDRFIESLLKYADRNEGVAISLYSYGLIMKFENIPEQRRENIE